MPVIKTVNSITEINSAQWNQLAGEQPFLRHEFFLALEQSGCVRPQTGWQPHFISLTEQGILRAALPLYLKYHSYGEYVFDWAWADSYTRTGARYYPKLVSAIPFTPVTGKRLLGENKDDQDALARHTLNLALGSELSSVHYLFPERQQALQLQSLGLALRRGTQFHWKNPGYASFADFLASLTRDKRKKIQQERRRIRDAGITFQRLTGSEIREEQWNFFFKCYVNTYREHRSSPYLNLDFFHRLGEVLGNHILLVIALREGVPIATALNLFDSKALYGRYWGAKASVPNLHFETCYYQAIDFCIDHKLAVFEAGAQGEHKLARGFLPTETWSAHWFAREDFSRAVSDFLRREAQLTQEYLGELAAHSPFKPIQCL